MKVKLRYRLSLGVLFIGASLLLGFDPLMHYLQGRGQPLSPSSGTASQVQAAQVNATADVAPLQGKPSRLLIPRLGLDLQVADGTYNAKSKTWTLSKDKAHYALITALANNQAGNTFIYGHNRREVFANLSRLQPGDMVVVHTDNGHTFTYSFRSAYDTNPNDDSLFAYHGKPILTMQTCSGIWYQNRRLFTFDLVGARA